MRQNLKRETMPQELAIAIGLVWGHLNAGQFDQAEQLARGCLEVWPDEKRLVLMAAYARVELAEPLDAETLAVLKSADCPDWTQLVLRRAERVEHMESVELAASEMLQ